MVQVSQEQATWATHLCRWRQTSCLAPEHRRNPRSSGEEVKATMLSEKRRMDLENESFVVRCLARLWRFLTTGRQNDAGWDEAPPPEEAGRPRSAQKLSRPQSVFNPGDPKHVAIQNEAAVNRRKLSTELTADENALQEEVQRLRKLLAFYESLVDELPTPIFAKTAKLRFCLFNKAYEEFFGVKRQNLLGRTLEDAFHLSEEDRIRYQEEDTTVIREGIARHYATEYDTPTGKRQAMYWSKGFGDRALGTWAEVGMIVDISEQVALKRNLAAKVEELKRVQQKLRYMSRSDALTGLANRRPFAEYLALGMDLAQRKQIPMCMLMADIDHFKQVNDTYGHDNGDMILKAVAGMLRSSCRAKDLAARIGGEEFVILLAATRLEDAILVAERIRKNIGDTPLLPDGSHVTISIGVARYRPNESPQAFMKRVDEALYRAKESGRNRVCRG